jgi:nucleoside-diphosphate-sugar epimerase
MAKSESRHVIVTGGAGYIGSMLTAELLRQRNQVTVIDNLLFGGESLLGFTKHTGFNFIKGDVCEPGTLRQAIRTDWQRPSVLIHLAAIVGFPACQAVGRQAAFFYNVEAVKRTFDQAEALGVQKFIFSSTYSVYGQSEKENILTEDSPLNPHSLYAETKVTAEEWLRSQTEDVLLKPLIFRLATLYGLSPRMRFDLIINQFVLDAYLTRELIIYQRGYSRSFIHVFDVVRCLIAGVQASREVLPQLIYNLGTDTGNYTKDEVVALIIKRFPEVDVNYKDLTFGGDIRDIHVSFERLSRAIGFKANLTVDDGIRELTQALKSGVISNPQDRRYRNADLIVK